MIKEFELAVSDARIYQEKRGYTLVFTADTADLLICLGEEVVRRLSEELALLKKEVQQYDERKGTKLP